MYKKIIFAISCSVAITLSCANYRGETKQVSEKTDINGNISNMSLGGHQKNVLATDTNKIQKTKDILTVDFQNFTYPWIPTENKKYFGKDSNIKLKEGRIFSSEDEIEQFDVAAEVIAYTDLNDDGIEDAVVSLSILLPNRAMPNCVFVYTIKNSKPLLLWKYESGKRDVKGFKDISVENNNLIIEEFNIEDSPICCPRSFYKTFFVWKDNSFQVDKEELLPYVKGNRLP